jgi:hypothetical protein
MSRFSHLHAIEEAVVRNKWFSLAVVCVLFGMFAYTQNIRSKQDYFVNAIRCHEEAMDIFMGINHEYQRAPIGSHVLWLNAKTHFNSCLLVEGVDPTHIPAFDDMFPMPEADDEDAEALEMNEPVAQPYE